MVGLSGGKDNCHLICFIEKNYFSEICKTKNFQESWGVFQCTIYKARPSWYTHVSYSLDFITKLIFILACMLFTWSLKQSSWTICVSCQFKHNKTINHTPISPPPHQHFAIRVNFNSSEGKKKREKSQSVFFVIIYSITVFSFSVFNHCHRFTASLFELKHSKACLIQYAAYVKQYEGRKTSTAQEEA